MKRKGKKIGNRDEKTDQKNGRNRKQKIAGCNAVQEGKKNKVQAGGRATLARQGGQH